MWLSDRRNLTFGLVAGLFALSGCGFTPAYGPASGAGRLQGTVYVIDPGAGPSYEFVRHIEERLGPADPSAPYELGYRIQMDLQGIGATSSGSITRNRIVGRAFYTLKAAESGDVLAQGRVTNFTGYSTTSTPVASRASDEDARERLVILLADQVIDALILAAPDLP